jgi:hypothetical protein
LGAVIDKVLANPLAGLAPWIIYTLVEGQGRLELSAAIAFGTALLVLLVGWVRGSSPKLLEFSDVVFFGALAIFVAVASDSTHAWLELWSGEIANVALVVVALGSILIRQPFTLQYAKEEAPRELWSNPAFLRANYVITGAWAIAFVIEAASGLYGDAVLQNSNNIWTGWIIQTLPLIVAIQFTFWYPARLRALAAQRQGDATAQPPPISDFISHVTPWIAIIGVVVLFLGDAPTWLGIAFIVAGVLLTKALQPEKGPATDPAA